CGETRPPSGRRHRVIPSQWPRGGMRDTADQASTVSLIDRQAGEFLRISRDTVVNRSQNSSCFSTGFKGFYIIVSWNTFLRGFGLANGNNVLHDRGRYMNLFGLEVNVSPFQRALLPARGDLSTRADGRAHLQRGFIASLGPGGSRQCRDSLEWGAQDGRFGATG